MGNWITYDARPDVDDIKMPNGLTSVSVTVLSLAASALATTDRHRTFAVWIASRDQMVGVGCVGFDISEMPWSPDSIQEDKYFILRSIAAAKEKTGWERLDYQPREDWLMPCLDKFANMIEQFDIAHAVQDKARIWRLGGLPPEHVLCPIHRVYEHAYGCPVCHDGSVEVRPRVDPS